jgi:hypothetical protein
MTIDKSALKRCIDQSTPKDLLVLAVNKLEKNSLQMCQKEIDRFIKKSDDYVITVTKRC